MPVPVPAPAPAPQPTTIHPQTTEDTMDRKAEKKRKREEKAAAEAAAGAAAPPSAKEHKSKESKKDKEHKSDTETSDKERRKEEKRAAKEARRAEKAAAKEAKVSHKSKRPKRAQDAASALGSSLGVSSSSSSTIPAASLAPPPQALPPALPSVPRPPSNRPNPFTASASSSSPAQRAFDPSLFPPGFDFAAMSEYLAAGGPPNPRARSRSREPSAPPPTSSADPELLRAVRAHTTSTSYRPPPVARAPPSRRPMPAKGSRLGSDRKERTIAEAAGLTHRQMLVDRTYSIERLHWLREAYGLQWREGIFSRPETEALLDAVKKYQSMNGLSDSALSERMYGRKGAPYPEMWREIASALPDRPTTAVRVYLKRYFHPDARKGAWTPEEQMALAEAVVECGHDWTAVAKRVGRTNNDCIVRWQHYGSIESSLKKGKWTEAEQEALVSAVKDVCASLGQIPDKDIPWAAVARKLGNARPQTDYLRKWKTLASKAKRKETAAAVSQDDPDEEPAETEVGDAKWSRKDDLELVNRMTAQNVKDDSEIDWAALSSDKWTWYRGDLRKKWRYILKRRLPDGVSKDGGLQSALKILRPILEERAQRPSKSKSRNRKRPQGEVPEPVSSSMITEEMESDEE